jgi:REP-associated tyrosine transposase
MPQLQQNDARRLRQIVYVRLVRHRIYYHIVWATRDRAPFIDAGLASFLCRFLRQVAHQERTHILEIGMVTTHVHVLARAHPMTDLARLLQRMKGASSAIAGKERHSTTGTELRWSKGYAIHSVSARNLDTVRQYLREQAKHHPREVIEGWAGDTPEYEPDGSDEWRGPERRRI